MTFRKLSRVAVVAAVSVPLLALAASPLDSLKGAVSGAAGVGGGSSAALLGQLGSGSFALGSAQNVAGVLAWCQAQGYAPSASETVKDRIMDKIGLQSEAEPNHDYKAGAAGVLQDAQGGQFNLSRFKDVAGKKVCSAVTDQAASSLLGGL